MKKMANFSAKDVQTLRQATGAGMMDAKKALEANDGDMEQASQWLRERGLGKAAERGDRENNQGVIALKIDGQVGAIVQLKCETDFVAGSEQFNTFANHLVDLVIAKGVGAVAEGNSTLEDLKITLKENIELGRVERIEAAAGNILDGYQHLQGGRGVNGVLVEVSGATAELAHDIAVHVAFARPTYLNREQVPAELVAAERVTLENITRNEGKPEAAIARIVDGRINGFYKDLCLVEQAFAKDDKVTVAQLLGTGSVVSFVQVEIG
jgi:elongation factor Ts